LAKTVPVLELCSKIAAFLRPEKREKMKNLPLYILFGIVGIPGSLLGADQNIDLEALKRELRELRQRTEELEKKLETLQTSPVPAVPAISTNITTAPAGPEPAVPSKWSPSQPITLMRSGGAYMNIGFDALLDVGGSTASDPSAQLELGDHDPIQRGFSMRNAEISFDGAVDPYFSGFANFVFKLDKDNSTEIEAEEVYAKTTSLPGNIQLRAGQYFANFGRQNPQHPHAWAFVDQPIILGRVLGPEGLRNLGGEIAWLAPTPFYTELTLSVMNGNSGQSFLFRNDGDDDGSGTDRFRGRRTTSRDLRGPGDLLFVPRVSASFDITDTQTLLIGTSGAFGPNNTGTDERTEIYGADIFWKWKSPKADKGFPFVVFQTEGLLSRFEAGEDPLAGVPLPAETLYDYGFYSQVLWGFKPGWVAGLRGDWADGNSGTDDPNDPFRTKRTRISPNLTWYPTEFSKLRLQYNYDNGEQFGDEHSVWLQFEFQLGAHSAHKF
jgi:hypothetical protein